MDRANQLVNQLIESSGNYVTKVDAEVYGIGDRVLENNEKATIHWSLEMDIREYGVKEFIPTIESIRITWTEDDLDIQGDGAEQPREFSWPTTETRDFRLKIEPNQRSIDGYYPRSATLDISKKTILIFF